MLGTVVDVIQHDVFDRHAALVGIGLRNITTYRVQEGLDIIFLVDRHDFVTNGIVRRVQRDSQRDVNHIAKLIKRRHHAGSGERDATF